MMRIRSRPASSGNGPRLREWIEWFDFLEKEMIEVCLVRSVYAEVRHMIERNPDLHRPSIFYSWMRALYFTRTVISITRLLEDDKKTKSFVRLLRRIEQQPQVLSRSQFVAAYLSSEGMACPPKTPPK